MNNKILYIITLSLGMIAYGQVGINTTNPQQTLDINGGMRIGELGTPDPNSVPLAINTTTKQVIKATDESGNNSPFHTVTYRINMSKNNSLTANNVDLKINSKRYKAIVTQAYIVKSNFVNDIGNSTERGGASRAGVFLPAQGRTKAYPGENFKRLRLNGGYLFNENSQNYLNDDSHYDDDKRVLLTFPLQDVKLEEKNSSYFLTANYGDTVPAGNYKYTWIVDVLIVNRNLAKIID